MQTERALECEDLIELSIDSPMHDVSLSSIKTQDSIENNSMLINIDEEEYKEGFPEIIHLRDLNQQPVLLTPFLTYKETQHAIAKNLSTIPNKLTIRPLSEILLKINKISADFQCWKKQE